MAHSSQNQNPIHQSATAGFQPESIGLQSPFDSQLFNSMPANGMASRSAGAPASLNISAQADSTQIDVGFAGDNQDGQKPFSMKLNGLGLGNPTEWAQGLRQVGNAMSSWLQRVSGEIVGADATIERPGAGLPKPSEMGGAGAPKTLVGIIDTGFGANDHGRKILDTIQTGDNDTSVWLGGGVGAGTWADSLNEFVDVAKASGNPRAVANLSFDLSQVNPDGSVSTRYQLTAKEQTALANAAANDVLVVAASGNQGGVMSALGLAAQQHDNVIAVGAAEGNDRAAYSSYGPGLDFLAEGTGPGGKGTSIAAANLTETITDVWAANPNLSSGQVVQTLKDTATDLHQPGLDIKTGHGLVDRDRAVEQASAGGKADQSGFDRQQEQLGSHLSLNAFDSQNKVFPDSAIASERPALSDKEIAKAMDGAASKVNALNRINVPPENDVDRLINVSPEEDDGIQGLREFGNFLKDPPQLYIDQVFTHESGKPPVESKLVKQWQEKMNELGYPIGTDGKFGRESAKAALKFQKKNGLPADGILGPETWKATSDALKEKNRPNNGPLELFLPFPGENLKNDGSFSTPDRNVEVWQRKMRDAWGYDIKVDGRFGSESEAIAKEFQQRVGVKDDGIVGPDTWKKAFSSTPLLEGLVRFGDQADNLRTESSHLANIDLVDYSGQIFSYKEGASLDNEPLVYLWQSRMEELGYDINPTGKYDEKSKQAAIAFQKKNDLTPDGILGPKTWDRTKDKIDKKRDYLENSPITGTEIGAAPRNHVEGPSEGWNNVRHSDDWDHLEGETFAVEENSLPGDIRSKDKLVINSFEYRPLFRGYQPFGKFMPEKARPFFNSTYQNRTIASAKLGTMGLIPSSSDDLTIKFLPVETGLTFDANPNDRQGRRIKGGFGASLLEAEGQATIFKKGNSDQNKILFGGGIGRGTAFEFYLDEDTDQDGRGEWGGKIGGFGFRLEP